VRQLGRETVSAVVLMMLAWVGVMGAWRRVFPDASSDPEPAADAEVRELVLEIDRGVPPEGDKRDTFTYELGQSVGVLAFEVPEELDADLILIGTGTGIAPFRALLKHMAGGSWVELLY